MTDLSYVAAHPSGALLAVASRDGWLTVWSPSTDRIVALHKLPVTINKVGWLAGGTHLLATEMDRLRFWSSDGAEERASVDTGHGLMRTFAVHPSQAAVATIGADAVVRLWSTGVAGSWTARELLRSEGEGSGGGTAIVLTAKAIVAGYHSGYFAACDFDGECLAFGEIFDGGVAALAAFPDGTTFIAGGSRGGMKVMHGHGDPWVSGAGWAHPPRAISTNTIEVGADGRWLAAFSDGSAELFSSGESRRGQVFGQPFYVERRSWSPAEIVSAACFIPGTSLIATSHFGGFVTLWHQPSGRSQRVRFNAGRPTWEGALTAPDAWRSLVASR